MLKRIGRRACFSAVLCVAVATSMLAQESKSTQKDTLDVYEDIILTRVTIVGSPSWKSNIPGAASYVNAEKLQEQKYDDINRVLRNISGINIREEDGYGLRPNIGIRGAGLERSSKINIMEDGVLISPAPYSAPAAYYFPMVSRMSAVEVRKGSAQIKYGPNTTGGAINMISTPIPYELSGRAELGIGERNARKIYANIGDSFQNVGYLIEGMNITTDGFKELDGGGNTGFNIQDYMGKFMVRTGPDADIYQRLELKGGYYDEVSNETYLGLTRDDFKSNAYRRYAASRKDQMTAQHVQFMARHFVQFSTDFDITTTFYRNNFERNWYKLQSVDGISPAGVVRDPGKNVHTMAILRGATSTDDALSLRANNRAYYAQGIESKLAYSFNAGQLDNTLSLGIRYHYDEEDRFQLEDYYRMQNGEMILTTQGTPGSQANRIGSANAFSIYLQDEINVDKFTFTPGFRVEQIDFTNKNYGKTDPDRMGSDLTVNKSSLSEFIPGIGIIYNLNDNLSLISGVHKGFSPPSPGSSNDTESEQSVNYEIGTRFFSDNVHTEVFGFFNNYTNLLGSDLAAGGGGGTNARFNAGEVETYGVEATLSTNLNSVFKTSFGIPISMNYTFTQATFQNTFDSDFKPWGSVQEGDKLPFVPVHQFNANLGLKFYRLDVNINANSVASMRTQAGSGSIDSDFSTDSYFLLDVSSSFTIKKGLFVFINVRNALDKTYIVSDKPYGLRPGLPRTISGGIKYTL